MNNYCKCFSAANESRLIQRYRFFFNQIIKKIGKTFQKLIILDTPDRMAIVVNTKVPANIPVIIK